MQLEVVKRTEVKRGFALLGHGAQLCLAARFRRPARNYERLVTTLAALHYLAFACIMLAN